MIYLLSRYDLLEPADGQWGTGTATDSNVGLYGQVISRVGISMYSSHGVSGEGGGGIGKITDTRTHRHTRTHACTLSHTHIHIHTHTH